MYTDSDDVFQQLGVDIDNACKAGLAQLKAHYRRYISQNRQFVGDDEFQFQDYVTKIKHYYDEVLPHENDGDILESIAKLNNQSMFQHAIFNGYSYLIEKWLDKDNTAMINEPFDNGQYPLHLAALMGDEAITLALLSKGAKVMQQNSQNELPLHLALKLPMLYADKIIQFKSKIFNSLLNEAPEALASQSADGSTPLHQLVLFNDIALLKTACDKNKKALLIPNNYGRLPIHVAIINLCHRQVEHLLNVFKDKNPQITTNGQTPLHIAAKDTNPQMIALCYEKGNATIDAVDNQGQTPLILAAHHGHEESVSWFIANNADLMHRDKFGKNALMHAIENQHLNVVNTLVQAIGEDALSQAERDAISQLNQPKQR